ncbi:unnamed protein product [Owenia fusiformis]|uniref:Uncharacterized protein n=1 Tax=Owenia fusiformis TaxID=6347 RepID=A0A8J1U630_OWEFU|nr:unnamed protein product [Owenia fusiformis]
MEVDNYLESEMCLIEWRFDIDKRAIDCETCSLFVSLLNSEYERVLDDDCSADFLKESDVEEDAKLRDIIQQGIDDTMRNHKSNHMENRLLSTGIAALQLFVQNNWIGPPSTSKPSDYFEVEEEQLDAFREDAISDLSIDGDTVYPICKDIEYMYLAKIILHDNRHHLKDTHTGDWWLLRLIRVWQQLIEERSPTLKKLAMEIIEQKKSMVKLLSDTGYKNAAVRFNLEAGYMCNFYYERTRGKQHFADAENIAGLHIETTGELGKRTKWQETELPQLVLNVTRSHNQLKPPNDKPPKNMPRNLALNDDTVLDQIQLNKEVNICELSGLDEAVVLAKCSDLKSLHESQSDLIKEEILAHTNCVLSQERSWVVQTAALLERTKWESENVRRMERSMTQLEELINQVKREEPQSYIIYQSQKMDLFYSVSLPPKWKTEKTLADFFIKIGTVKAALEIYERLQMWDNVIVCYGALGRVEAAEKKIREQLSVKEEPMMYCYLGDVTEDPSYYDKAWEMSNHRSFRSMRSKATYLFRKGKFEESLSCFEASLQANALQSGCWFTYGCAAMSAGNFERAAKAFQQGINLDDDNFEAWNNLSSAYIKLGQKKRAFMTLKEAIKGAYENWRVWENYLVCALDIGEFSDGVMAYHRLLDIKEKYAEPDLLNVLVRAVVENFSDAHGNPASVLKPKVIELFGRVTSKHTNVGKIWKLYAQLHNSEKTMSFEKHQKVVELLQKAHRCAVTEKAWEKDMAKCNTIGANALELTIEYMKCSNHKDSKPKDSLQMLSSAKLMINGLLSKIKQNQIGIDGELNADVKDTVNKLTQQQQDIAVAIDTIKATNSG